MKAHTLPPKPVVRIKASILRLLCLVHAAYRFGDMNQVPRLGQSVEFQLAVKACGL